MLFMYFDAIVGVVTNDLEILIKGSCGWRKTKRVGY
jgi:hypothetical protein